ncbi:CPBP family intramembrane metalloprotease [Mycetocola tolaasinivorans]|uniref:CPBP family intramembrane metalloprotease n=1 Tax=Mycetocola tolaasinivorans TaxID=76635 RepID=A0A3L7A5C6_9MICO|nr:type II CAAX endopeptidase family protein [Mycetocola tolaasinivorans]RLP74522.1 CPBP family intramembrane metalloprotease [Mycetocola tolaasinivorans]
MSDTGVSEYNLPKADTRPDRLARVPWRAVTIFTLVAWGLAWLVILPLWLTNEDSPVRPLLTGTLPLVMMFTPLLAVLVVVFALRVPRGERLRFLGVWPLRPAKRVVWFMVLATIVPLLLVAATLGISTLFGWVTLDLVNFSGFKELAGGALPVDDSLLGVIVITQILTIPFAALFNTIPALGEEIGWRGWLLPALRPLGLWPALIVSGVIWGLWHTPIILLGHNFGLTNGFGVLLMVVGCVFWGVLFGWVRLRTGSIWPAAIGHGSLNAAGGLVFLVTQAGAPMDLALVNPLGVSGWIVLAVIVLVLYLTGQFKHEPQLAPRRVPTA